MNTVELMESNTIYRGESYNIMNTTNLKLYN